MYNAFDVISSKWKSAFIIYKNKPPRTWLEPMLISQWSFVVACICTTSLRSCYSARHTLLGFSEPLTSELLSVASNVIQVTEILLVLSSIYLIRLRYNIYAREYTEEATYFTLLCGHCADLKLFQRFWIWITFDPTEIYATHAVCVRSAELQK